MPTKSVLVRLKGENSDLNRALLGSAAASKVLGRNLDDADDSSRRLSDSLEVSNDRTTMLVQSALAIGPALVPIGAQAVPVIMGLGTQLGFAAGAAGVTALAFQGIGKTLKSVNDYAIDPTDAHLKAMQLNLAALGPAGRDFVMFLQDLRPRMQELQNIAQAGMLPGVEDGLTSLMTKMPQVERIISTISTTLGGLVSDAGKDLAGPEWEKFFNYIESDAQPILSDMSRTVGNFVHGIADMVVAFGPMTRDFSDGLLGMSRDFETWAAGLSDSNGFHSFVAYIEETGPQVVDTLGALAGAVLAIVEAAAPVGQVALPILEALANTIGAIASTPIGTVLIGVAAGVSAISRSLALFEAANGSLLLGSIMGGTRGGDGTAVAGKPSSVGTAFNTTAMRSAIPAMREYDAAVGEMAAAEAAASAAHARYLGALRASSVREELIPGIAATKTMTARTEELQAANVRQAEASRRVAEAEKARSGAIRESLAGAGKAAALVGGLAVATSGYAQSAGFANTAGLALMGTMAGPWGIAAGAAIGFTMDLAASNNSLEDSFKNLKVAMGDATPTADSLTAYSAAVDDAQAKLSTFQGQINDYNTKGGYGLSGLGWQAMHPMQAASGFKNTVEGWFGSSDVEEYQAALDKAKQEEADLQAQHDLTGASSRELAQAMDQSAQSAYQEAAGIDAATAASRNKRAEAARALDAELNYKSSILDARDALKTNGKTVNENTRAGQANLRALYALAPAWNAQTDAAKNAKGALQAAKKNFIDTAVSMNMPIDKARELAKKLFEIPTSRQTAFNTPGWDVAIDHARAVQHELNSIDRNVDIYINAHTSHLPSLSGMGPQIGSSADGGVVPKTGLPYADRHLYLLADGERITSNRRGQADKYATVLEAINRDLPRGVIKGMLADGGVAGWNRPQPQPQPSAMRSSAPVVVSAQSLVGLRIEGAVNVNGLDGHLRGTIREEIDADREFQHVRAGGMNRG